MGLSRTEQMIVNNPYQGNDERILVVCSVGMLRSPTVVRVAHEMGLKKNMRAVGLDVENALIPISEKLLEWADSVIAMDFTQCQEVQSMGFEGEIYNFNIFDDYDYYHNELINLIMYRLNNLSQFNWDML